jgi:hypothetical protein
MPKKIKIAAETAAEASAAYCAKRDASGEGASTFPCGDWNGHHISYNGRVWQKEPTPGFDLRAIYNPGGGHPLWADSTA